MLWVGDAPTYAIQADSTFDVTVEIVTDQGIRVTDGIGADAVIQLLVIASLDYSPTSRQPVEVVAEEGVAVFEGVSLQSAGLGLLFISVSHLSNADDAVFGTSIMPLEQLVRVAPLPPVINMTELRCPWLVAGSYTRCQLILRDRNENEVPAIPCSTEYGGEAVCIDSSLRGPTGETSPVRAPPTRPALPGPAHTPHSEPRPALPTPHTKSPARPCSRPTQRATTDGARCRATTLPSPQPPPLPSQWHQVSNCARDSAHLTACQPSPPPVTLHTSPTPPGIQHHHRRHCSC